jgi:uncharacterized membrane protein
MEIDKKFVIHIVSEIIIIIGVIVFFIRKTSHLLSLISNLEGAARSMASKITELEKKLYRIDELERLIINMQTVLTPLPQLHVPFPAPIHTFTFSKPVEKSHAKITTFDDELGISDVDEFVNVSKDPQSELDELSEELAELEIKK